MKVNKGKIWAYSVGFSIILVFGFCVATVMITSSANIQVTNEYMTSYQEAENNANDYINDKIAFDKKYKISYAPTSLTKSADVLFKVMTLNGDVVENAKLTILVSRPETHVYDQKLESTTLNNGNYTFDNVKFEKVGVWDIITKVEIGKYSRFYNIKVDTRNKLFSEY
ncbi:MAG: FixH family protein [Sulfurimonas sp.]